MSYLYKDKLDFKKIFTIGITGSCGKTTTTLYIYNFLKDKGIDVCYIGTHKIYYKNKIINTKNTTLEINNLIDIFKNNNINPKYIVMEVSSHGINQARINCFDYNIIGLTNLGHDHLDYHQCLENYHNVKLAFFNTSFAKYKFIDYKYKDKVIKSYRVKFLKNNKIKNKFNTISFNKDNMYLAYSILRKLKFSKKEIFSYLNNINLDNGRISIIHHNNRKIIIDYAHHVESFKAILDDNNNEKVVIFGCGGNRDKIKRHLMGEIACKYSNNVIITEDNSRNENLDDIIADITLNINNYKVIKDRKEAIKYGFLNFPNQDIYILGKGDENFIEKNNVKIPFNDKDYVKSLINLYTKS